MLKNCNVSKIQSHWTYVSKAHWTTAPPKSTVYPLIYTSKSLNPTKPWSKILLLILIPWAEHLSTSMSKTWNPLPPYLKVTFQPVMKTCPVRGELKGYGVTIQGSGAAGKRDGRAAVGHLGATTLRAFLPCHFLSITIDVGNVEKGRCCRFHGNGGKRMSKHCSVGCHISPVDFQLGHCVWNPHRRTLFQPVGVVFSGLRAPKIQFLK